MESNTFPPTIRDYFSDSYKFESTATILNIRAVPSSTKFSLLLDKTIFHPQGGGQPSDKGSIESAQNKDGKSIRFNVQELSIDKETDTIWHTGEYENDTTVFFEANDEVKLIVDEVARRVNAQLHSAGHLIDMAVSSLNLNWSPGKGYHFPDGPYVEYVGKPVEDMVDLGNKIETIVNEKIKEKNAENTIVKMYELEEAKKEIEVPDYIQPGKPFRYVRLTKDDKGCPCGGTHVKNVNEIGGLQITKVAKKGKNIRVCYVVKSS